METEPTLGELSQRVTTIERSVDARLEAIERTLAGLSSAGTIALPPPEAATPPTPPPLEAVTPSPPGVAVATQTASELAAAPPPRPEDLIRPSISVPTPLAAKPKRNFEIGVEVLLRWVGIALVVLAAVFLVSTAIDRGWITPEMQLAGAAIMGAAMLANAVRLLAGSDSTGSKAANSEPVEPSVDRLNLTEQFNMTRRHWATAFGNGGSAVLIISAGAAYGWLGLGTAGTGLGLVAIAAAISLLVAMNTRLESVAITSTAAMFIVPTWAEIIIDAPVVATGIWLGGFAIVALVVGLDQRWSLYRLLSTVAAAVWTLGLAAGLAFDDNTDHRIAGFALITVIATTVWLGPALSAWRQRSMHTFVRALEYRLVLALPLWCYSSAALFSDLEAEVPAGQLALALAAGFFALALAARYLAPNTSFARIEDTLLASHLLGAGVLLLVGSILLLGVSTLAVAMAGQAVASLLIGYRLKDSWLKASAWLLAGFAGLFSAGELAELIGEGSTGSITVDFAALAVVCLLGIFAFIVDRHEIRQLAEVLYGLVWLLAIVFVSSIMTQTSYEEGWLVFATTVAAVSALAARRLGIWVLALGVSTAGLTMFASAFSIAQAFNSTATPAPGSFSSALVADLAANLVVVLALCGAAAYVWHRSTSQGGKAGIARVVFGLAWVWSLAWLAAVLFQLGSPLNQVAITVVWALAAGVAIVAAIVTAEPMLRAVGLTTLGAVLVKLLVVDLAEVDTLWRVGLFLVIGLGLLRLGYVLPSLAERYGPRKEAMEPAGVPSQS